MQSENLENNVLKGVDFKVHHFEVIDTIHIYVNIYIYICIYSFKSSKNNFVNLLSAVLEVAQWFRMS